MQIRTLITVKALPVWFIGTLILLTLSDLLPQFGSATSPPGLLGIIPVLAIAALGMFVRERRINFTAPLLLLCGIIACWMSTVWLSGGSTTNSILLAATGLTLVCSICVVLLSFREENEELVATEVSSEFQGQTVPAGIQSMDDFLTANLEESEPTEVGESDGEVVQSWTRVRLGDQSERLEGTIHLHFQAGERIQHCHIPLSPAFSTIPEAWSECHDDSFQAEFTTLQTYGVRLTVRRSMHDLDACTTEVSVMLLSSVENRSVA